MRRNIGYNRFKVELQQMDGNTFYFYIRTPEMWNGLRVLYHVHKGPCRKDCEPNCDGYNEQAAGLVLLVAQWLQQAEKEAFPSRLARKSLDEVIADIAKGLGCRPKRRRRA